MKNKKFILVLTFSIILSCTLIACGNIGEYKSPESQEINSENNKSEDGFSNIAGFWSDFRNAIINNNIEEVKKHTKFPLKTRGPMDEDKVFEHGEDEFNNMFSDFLSQDAGTNGVDKQIDYIKNNESFTFVTQEEYVKANGGRKLVSVSDNARIGDMVFVLVDGEWKLSFIYMPY
ncbi:hypothetical protein [Clostridium sp. UBA1652]|uniref:hypothetical protein n=1 Tax=Clostridium sp. UBA1652 TaxID=1946348 RepID=UPI00257C5518|nr:hypothetical protein [Clostridium sp. UBA1652]